MRTYLAYRSNLDSLAHVATLEGGGIFKLVCGGQVTRKNVAFAPHIARVSCMACRTYLEHPREATRHVEIGGVRHVLDVAAVVKRRGSTANDDDDDTLIVVDTDYVLRCVRGANVSPDPEDGRRTNCLDCLAEISP